MAPLKTYLLALVALSTTTVIAAPLQVRQLHGEGVALDALFTDTDNGVGYGVEDAEDNTANLITSLKGGQGTAAPGGPGTKRSVMKRQGDKVANGAAAILNAAGSPQAANEVQTTGDSLDGDLTDGVANLGTEAGTMEENTLIDIGKGIPKY